jgi:hypothetical protein
VTPPLAIRIVYRKPLAQVCGSLGRVQASSRGSAGCRLAALFGARANGVLLRGRPPSRGGRPPGHHSLNPTSVAWVAQRGSGRGSLLALFKTACHPQTMLEMQGSAGPRPAARRAWAAGWVWRQRHLRWAEEEPQTPKGGGLRYPAAAWCPHRPAASVKHRAALCRGRWSL